MTLPDIAEAMRDIAFAMLSTRTEGGDITTRPTSNNGNVEFNGDSLRSSTLDELGEPFDAIAKAELPAFYRLVQSDSHQADNFDPPPGFMSGRAVWSDDPWTWTSMLRGSLRLLADATNVPLELLRRRCATFMSKEGGREAFGPEVEERILSRLRQLNLQFAYRRPMASACLRAIGKVIQELDSANAVDPGVFHVLWDEIGGPPLSDIEIDDTPRPSWAEWPKVPIRKYGGIESDLWLGQNSEMAACPLPQDEFILAEKTFFAIRAWRCSAEIERISLPNLSGPGVEFEKLPRLFSLDYPRPMYKRDESRIVCRVPGDLFGDFRSETLTDCPYLVKDLVWKRSASNPFVLHDSKGAPVARTIRWIEGTHRKSGFDAELFGSGQVVVLTTAGRSQIEAVIEPIKLSTSINARFISETGETSERKSFAIN